MESFTPKKLLLNPKFEGYKLDPVSQEDVLSRFPLEYRPTQVTAFGKSPPSFQEVQSRITHNHIAVFGEAGRAVYVDSEARVVLIDVNPETIRPSFRVLYELPKAIKSDAVDAPSHEYPSVAFLTSTMVFVADGTGTMYILQVKEGGPSEALGIFTLSTTSASPPFRIHSVHRPTPATAVAILSSRHYPANSGTEPQPSTRGKPMPIPFDILAAKFELLSLRPHSNDIRQMDILWRRRGEDVPIYTAYERSLKSYLLIGGTSYREVNQRPSPSYEPSPDEIVPIPTLDENLDANGKAQGMEPSKPPLYSWTQTHDSVTVAFPLPSSTPKSEIKVTFSPQTLTLHIENAAQTSVHIPTYSARNFWDGISPSSSYWTWDREAEHSFGLLTLHLDKQHEGTKWSQVFASTGTAAASETSPEDQEVQETLDPSELWHIREALEKYTTALRDGSDASGLGLGRGVPSLAEGEIDIEVDGSVGRKAYSTWVGEDGSVPTWWKDSREVPFQLLSTLVPGSDHVGVSIIVKNNLDGTEYSSSPEMSSLMSSPEWTHTSTFSALAFVLATKQDTRFTHHIPSEAVFAFEGGARGGNVYIYRAAPLGEKWAKQVILKIGDGPLLGVGGMTASGGRRVHICLTEGELVLIKNP